jgi:hypothetical protein
VWWCRSRSPVANAFTVTRILLGLRTVPERMALARAAGAQTLDFKAEDSADGVDAGIRSPPIGELLDAEVALPPREFTLHRNFNSSRAVAMRGIQNKEPKMRSVTLLASPFSSRTHDARTRAGPIVKR